MSELIPVALAGVPTVVAMAGGRAGIRFLEFIASTIRNPHTQCAYGRAVVRRVETTLLSDDQMERPMTPLAGPSQCHETPTSPSAASWLNAA